MYTAKLKRHEVKHTKEKLFQCNKCEKYFSRLDALKSHEKSMHTEKE